MDRTLGRLHWSRWCQAVEASACIPGDFSQHSTIPKGQHWYSESTTEVKTQIQIASGGCPIHCALCDEWVPLTLERPMPRSRKLIVETRLAASARTRHSRTPILPQRKAPAQAEAFSTNQVIEIKLPKPRTRLRDFHENNHEREQHQRLDEVQTQNQRQLNASARRRIASERFARRRRGTPLALRRQPRCDGDRETRSDYHPVGRTRCACARLRKRRDGQDREHHHHEQQHHDFPHFVSPYELPPVGG